MPELTNQFIMIAELIERIKRYNECPVRYKSYVDAKHDLNRVYSTDSGYAEMPWELHITSQPSIFNISVENQT